MNKLSVVIPCYNEAENIPLILKRFAEVLNRTDVELILVNNGSTDSTTQVLEQQLPQYPFARTILVEVNQGYGYGILAGLSAAKGTYLGWTHADMQTDLYDILHAYEIIEKNGFPDNVFVKGLRKGRSFENTLFTIGMSLFETVYLGTPLWDINAQPNVFHRNFFHSWVTPPHDFSLDLYVFYMAKHKGLRLYRFPVLFPERIHGKSTWNTGIKAKWKFIKRTISFSIEFKKLLKGGKV